MSSRRSGSRSAAALAVCLAAVLTGVPVAGAAQTIAVGSLLDTVDPSPTDGLCDAPCSLRAEIGRAHV